MLPKALPACLAVLALGTPAVAEDDISGFPGIEQLPAGYQAGGGFVAGMGIPYMLGDPTQLPTPPIYWVYKDKIIGFEVVMDADQVRPGATPPDILPVAGLPPINHIELEHSYGHALWLNPTWTVRVEFVSAYYLDRMIGY